MSNLSKIRAAQEAVMAEFRRDPASALGPISAQARIDDGLMCTVTQDKYEARMDMYKELGGGAAAPTPGFYFRAAVAGCVAIGIKMMAAREGVPLTSIAVDVEMDFDDSAMFGMGTNTSAPMQTRFDVKLAGDCPPATLESLVKRALEMDPFFLALRDPQDVKVKVSVG